MKYRISPREFLRAEPKRTSEGSGYNLLYILTCVITQKLLVSIKKSRICYFLREVLTDLILWIYFSVEEAILVCKGPVENSGVSAVKNCFVGESNS